MCFFAASLLSTELLLLLLLLLLVHCTFKWKIFWSQQKHCNPKKTKLQFQQNEDIVSGKLPFGRNSGIIYFPSLYEGIFVQPFPSLLTGAQRVVVVFVHRIHTFKERKSSDGVGKNGSKIQSKTQDAGKTYKLVIQPSQG